MDEKGWKITQIPDNQGPGFNLGDIPPEQRDAQRTALRECQVAAGDQPFKEMSESLARKLYGEVVKRGRCLTALGYDIQQPPSEATWVAQIMAQNVQDDPWDPYDDLPDVSSGEWSTVTTACPQGGLWGD